MVSLGEVKKIFKESLIVLSYFLTINFIFTNAGSWSEKLNELFALFSFIVFLILLFSSLENFWEKFRPLFFLLIFLAFFFFVKVEREIRLVVLGIFLIFIDLILRKGGIHRPLFSILTISTTFFLLFTIFIKNLPPLWFFLQYISQIFSKNVAKITGQNLLFGATASGLYITTLFILLLLAYFILSEGRKWSFFIFLSVLTLFLNSLYIILSLPILSLTTKIFKAYIVPTDISVIYILFLFLPLFLLPKGKVKVKELQVELDKNNFIYLFVGAVFVFLSCFLLNYHLVYDKKEKIFLFEEGYLNWEKPDFEKYGGRSWGMFGMLPEFLENIGFEVKKDKIINDKALEKVKILVIINLNKKLSAQEKHSIWNFVKNGGSLLCLGDHTGMQGIREPFNEILKPYGIEFNFDCGHYLKKRWSNDFEFMNHPITFNLCSDEDTGISVGASLKTFPSVIPVIIAKYGFSDRGNPNDPRNGYLGDIKYTNGELLGDIVLVAEKKYKKGKILVFGDTSSFQNLSLTKNPLFVERVFRYLSSQSNWIWKNKNYLSISIFLIGLIIFFSKLRNIFAYGILLLGIALGYQIGGFLNKNNYQSNILSLPKIALIDISHLERISLEPALETGILGITTNLIRNRYNPLILRKFSEKTLFRSKIFISIAPSKNFTKKEIAGIKEYIRKGGIFILSVGYGEKEGSKNLLETFGLEILNIPLGPVSPNKNSVGVQFYNAYPINIKGNSRIICKYKNEDRVYPLIVYKDYGKGKFLLIGDSNFLCDSNLENINYYLKENISFLKMLLQGELFK